MLYSCNDYNDPMSGGVYNDGQAYISDNPKNWHCEIYDEGSSSCFKD